VAGSWPVVSGWPVAGGWRVQPLIKEPATSHQSSITVRSLTERELVARVQQHLPPAPDWLLVGIGDDAAVVEPERNRVEVLSVDALVEGVHFDRAFVPPDAIGHRALAVNLSDLAAMGAAPRLALLSFALPSDLPLADFDGIVTGLARLAARHRIHVAGGNLTRSPGPLMIDITVVGTVKRRQALTRVGARPGDEIYVSGTLGAAAAGLRMLQMKGTTTDSKGATTEVTDTNRGHGTKPSKDPLFKESPCPPLSSVPSVVELCTQRYLYPEPRVRLGLLLARNRAASASIDLSDGLADGVHRIAEAGGVGAVIEADALPIDPAVRLWFEERGLDPVAEAMTAGDDYELLVTVRPRTGRRLAAAKRSDVPLTRIGTCTEGRAPVLRVRTGSTMTERELPRTGYDHFR
jgi:thiamine-monophosphate kinase